MAERLTKRFIDSLDATSKTTFHWDSDLKGFGLKVTPAGRKVYVLQYRLLDHHWKKAPKRLTVGRHGDLTPEQARKIAAGLLVDVRAGHDPAAARRTKRKARHTVAELAERFLTEHLPTKKRPPRESTIAHYELLFRVHILPVFAEKSVASITTEDVERLHQAKRSTPYVANRVLSLIQQSFDQAERWGWRKQHSNPALHVEKYPEARRGAKKEVMLTPSQMQGLLDAIDEEEAEGMSPYSAHAVRLAFWTGWRIGEVLSLRWKNVDLARGVARLCLLYTSPSPRDTR